MCCGMCFVFMGLVVVWNCGVTGIGSLSPWDHFRHTSTSLPFMASRMFVTPSPNGSGVQLRCVQLSCGLRRLLYWLDCSWRCERVRLLWVVWEADEIIQHEVLLAMARCSHLIDMTVPQHIRCYLDRVMTSSKDSGHRTRYPVALLGTVISHNRSITHLEVTAGTGLDGGVACLFVAWTNNA